MKAGQLHDCPMCAAAAMEQGRWLLLSVMLLTAIPLSENFEVTSAQNVVGIVGQGTLLPCHISSTKPLDNFEVQWQKITEGHVEEIHLYRHFDGKQTQRHSGWTSMPTDGFATGNVSVTLKNVQPADEGTYRCSVTFGNLSAHSVTVLSIAGTSEIFFDILGPQGQGLELACRSHGWFPKPTVQWNAENKQSLSPDTAIHQDSKQVFRVLSRVTVTEDVGEVTCEILNPLLQTEKKITVHLSGAAFPHPSPWLPAFWILLSLLLLMLAAVACLRFGRSTLEANTTRALESMQEKVERTLSEKMAVLQSQKELSHSATPAREEQTDTQTSLLKLSQDVLALKGSLENAQASSGARESSWEERLQGVSQEIQSLHKALQPVLESTQGDLQLLRAQLGRRLSKEEDTAKRSFSEDHLAELEKKLEFFKNQRHKVDVTLDADTAHPRLETSVDGKSVKDSGTIRKVPSNEKRFDSHLCVLAKEGFTRGRCYWEVNVGKRSSWTLGIARDSVTRQGILTMSPENGFWVIGFAHGREYWAYSEPWSHLSVSGNLQRVGIFLDMAAKQLSFYDVHKKAALYTFSIADGSSQEGKFLPFFSTGPAAAKPDTEPLKIVQGFDDEDDDD